MTFLWPYMLWLFVLVPIAVVIYLLLLRRKRKAAIRYGALNIVKQAMAAGPGFRRHVPPLLFLFAFALMLFALTRPAMELTLPSQRGTIIMAMDISGSMQANDVEPNRMVAAQQAARAFVQEQPDNVRLGLVAFAGTSTIVQPPTDDKSEVLAAIDLLRLQRGTAIGSGILSSLDTIFEGLGMALDLPPVGGGRNDGVVDDVEPPPFEPVEPGTFQSAIVVLLTDGQATEGPDPVEAAQIAADLGVRIYTVGLGTPEGVVLEFRGRSFRVVLDEETLMQIADTTNGEYYRAATQDELEEIYRNLSTELTFDKKQTEVTAIATALAAAFMVTGGLLSLMWFGRMV